MFTERKIEKFQQTISALPDTPNLSAAELKRRFDACPEELRTALTGVCDDGAALEKRMDAYRAETFEGEITRDMLTPAVRDELSGKAEQTALAAETAAREKTDAAVAQKCECYFGSYTGDGAANKTIALGFEPKAVLVFSPMGRTYSVKQYGGAVYDGGLALPGKPVTVTTYEGKTYQILETAKNGFTVYKNEYETGNGDYYPISTNDGLHYYIAFR